MNRTMRYALIAVVAFVLVAGQATRIVALQTGAISGSITDASTNVPVAGAKVTAIAPTGSYGATSSASGFYSIVGLSPDTYVITVSKSGYQTSQYTGVTVTQGINVRVDSHLAQEVRTIGHIPIKATRATLVQPDVVTDAYNVDTKQAEALKGTPLASEQFGLLTQLPGVSNAGGYPILRGGLENNEGYQIEGITVVDPFFNQFSNNDTFNGAQTIKVVLGAGDATQGGAGSGYINEVVKRGSYPAFGIVQMEFGVLTRQNNLNFEYGSATPDNRFSWFLSGRYQPSMAQGGSQGINGGGAYKPDQVVDGIHLNDQVGALKYTVAGDSLINMFYKFGSNSANQLQVYDEKGIQNYVGNYGTVTYLTPYYAYDPVYQNIIFPAFGIPSYTPAQLPVFIGQNPNQTYPNFPGQVQEYELTKIALSHQFSSTTFLNARVYRLNGNTNFNLTESNYPYLSIGFPSLFNDFYEGTPFQTTGAAFDLQEQAGDKNFISFGGEYKFSNGHLLLGYPPTLAWLFEPNEYFSGDFSAGGQFQPTATGTPRIPLPQYGTLDPEYVTDAYITDQIKPTSRLTLQPGLRFEQQRIHMPAGLYNVHALTPKFGGSYAFGENADTVLRVSYGHSTVFAPLGQVETIYQPPVFFKKFPATASICGFPTFSSTCANYYDQLAADWQNNIGINPAAFPGPQQSDSYDLSIEHEFANIASVKLTSWYRRDYDVIVNETLPIFVNGTAVNSAQTVTNNGSGHAFGTDLGLFRQISQGLSGQLNFTYINQFINYLSNFAFIPTVLPSTLATVVHPPYLTPFNAALALDYRRNGWRISPDIIYSHGTPQGFPQNYYVKINGVYQAVPNTNYFGNPNTPCYFVDPQVPGSAANPNIVGSLGGGCAKARNGTLGKANFFGNFTISKDITAHSTVGLSIFNLFDNRVVGYNNLAGDTGAYVNNGFGAYGSGSGNSQYFGLIPGAPKAFPRGPFFNTLSDSARSGLFFVNVRL